MADTLREELRRRRADNAKKDEEISKLRAELSKSAGRKPTHPCTSADTSSGAGPEPSCTCTTCRLPEGHRKQVEKERENPQASMWRHTWLIPGASKWTLSGHSRALERTGFIIEELKIMLDAGTRMPSGGRMHARDDTYTCRNMRVDTRARRVYADMHAQKACMFRTCIHGVHTGHVFRRHKCRAYTHCRAHAWMHGHVRRIVLESSDIHACRMDRSRSWVARADL